MGKSHVIIGGHGKEFIENNHGKESCDQLCRVIIRISRVFIEMGHVITGKNHVILT